MRSFKIRFEIKGGHVHCSLFTSAGEDTTYAKCGDFVVSRGPEFQALMRAMQGVAFVGVDPEKGILTASRAE